MQSSELSSPIMARESSQDSISPQCVSLSDLPEEIIHHIFSFMPPNYSTKVCTLSKRFYHLCMTSPYLNFICDSWPQCLCENFIRSFRRFLEERGGLKVQRVRFTWYCDRGDHSSLLHELLNILLEYNVEEVVIALELNGRRYFPTSLFQSQHLKVLEIYWDKRPSLRPLKLNNCLQVLTLHLGVVRNSVAEWISNFCPFLKCLTIKQGILRFDKPKNDRLIIKSSSLEELRITGINQKHVKVAANNLQSLYIEQNEEYGRNYVFVEINAPNIQNLTWVGVLLKLRFTEGLKMLRKAIIDVKPQHFPFSWPSDASLCQFLFESLKDLQGVRALHLSNWFIQFLAENNCIPTGLGNVRHLSLFTSVTMTSSFASSVAPFMMELMSVEVLHIRKSFKSYLKNYKNDDVEHVDEKLKLLQDLMPVQQLKKLDVYFDFEFFPLVNYVID